MVRQFYFIVGLLTGLFLMHQWHKTRTQVQPQPEYSLFDMPVPPDMLASAQEYAEYRRARNLQMSPEERARMLKAYRDAGLTPDDFLN